MAAKGGGSWKVAYADFVTAMMAFFLVMWITSQDQKIKEAVAHYFMDPMGFAPMGSTKKSGPTGSIFESVSNGNVPKEHSTAVGRGRSSYSTPNDAHSHFTKVVSDWIHGDDATWAHWKDQARRQRQLASQAKEVRDNPNSLEDVARAALAKQMREDLSNDVAAMGNTLYRDLLFDLMSEVNWLELAEDLLH